MDIIGYAESEWEKYLSLVGIDGSITAEVNDADFDKSKFGNSFSNYDARFDDAFTVRIKDGCGHIVATNERSVLLAVYESLRRLGYVFCFSGKNGDYLPDNLKTEDVRLDFTHYAAYRYRGVALCGPKELYSVLDYVDWMPKVGLNTFFREFRSNHLSWKSWYLKEENPYLKKDDSYSLQTGIEYDKIVETRVKERGLMFQAMGHGWNVAVISNDLYNDFNVQPSTVIDYGKVALVNGKRELPFGYIRCANLCLSQKSVRRKIVNEVLKYVCENPNTDVLQVFLGDSLNHVCECAKCKKYSLSDWLVLILNEIDRVLTKEKNGIKIAFGLYNDTLWPPEKVKLKGDRFILELCPISRDYSRSFGDVNFETVADALPLYRLNRIQTPVNPADFYAFYKKWRNVFNGEAIFFDYHGYYASRYDVSNTEAVSVAVKDIKSYKRMGFDGLISCQFYRNAFPHGFLCYATARALFDGDFDKSKEEKRYFEVCFGSMGEKVQSYLKAVNNALPLKDYQWYGEEIAIRETYEKPKINKKAFCDLLIKNREMNNELNAFNPENVVRQTCVKTLKFYLSTMDTLCNLFIKKAEGCKENALISDFDILKETLYKNEEYLLPYCSVDHLLQMIMWFIKR